MQSNLARERQRESELNLGFIKTLPEKIILIERRMKTTNHWNSIFTIGIITIDTPNKSF